MGRSRKPNYCPICDNQLIGKPEMCSQHGDPFAVWPVGSREWAEWRHHMTTLKQAQAAHKQDLATIGDWLNELGQEVGIDNDDLNEAVRNLNLYLTGGTVSVTTKGNGVFTFVVDVKVKDVELDAQLDPPSFYKNAIIDAIHDGINALSSEDVDVLETEVELDEFTPL